MTDPRFDPAFQRGYSGPAPQLVVRSAQSAPAAAPPSAVSTVRISPPVSASKEPNIESSRSAEVEPPEQSYSPELDEPWQRERRNPFGIALLAAGLTLLFLGGAMIWSTATAQNTTYTQGTFDTTAQALSIASYLLPPALLLGGVLGVLGWLVLAALGASERNRSR